MGQTLTNGIYLPNEGERNCYSGLAANWNAVDTLKGNYSLHAINVDIHVTSADKQTWDGHVADTTIHVTSADKQTWNSHVADTTIHVTSADKQAWNGKADASALTAHTGDTTIHVTAEDKQAWDGHVADSVKHVTAEDKNKWDAVTSKADDSAVVHKSGDETVNGIKNFKNMIPIDGDYLGNESSVNARTNICLRSNRDTVGKSGIYISKFRQNKAQGSMSTNDMVYISFDALENEVRTNNTMSIQCSGWVDDIPTKVKIISTINDSTFGSSARPSKINDLNPSSLGMPDLSNGIDISSYITIGDTDNNYYTPPANGWIWAKLIGNGLAITQGDFGINANYVAHTGTGEKWVEACLPVTKDVQATIRCRNITGIVGAKFYPCLGNI